MTEGVEEMSWSEEGPFGFWCGRCGPLSSLDETTLFLHSLRCDEYEWISDLYVYKRVLTQSEIQKLSEVWGSG